MQTKSLKIFIAVLIFASAVMLGYILYTFQQTDEPVAPVNISSPTAKKTPAPERALIQLEKTAKTVQRGGKWSINITTNTWAKCLADVYDLKDQVLSIDVEKAHAAFISPGKFQWTWDVPPDAAVGKWTIRILCGTFDNLATADQAVAVE